MGSSKLRDLLTIEKPWESYRIVWTDPTMQYDLVAVETQWDYGLESYFLDHCLGTKDAEEFGEAHAVYSLRDSHRIPHATVLCLRTGHYSVYQAATDLGTTAHCIPERNTSVRVLQVRGRRDRLAATPFHRLVRDWYLSAGGVMVLDPKSLDNWCKSTMWADHDEQYHYDYRMDDSNLLFDWAYHNERLRRQYQPR